MQLISQSLISQPQLIQKQLRQQVIHNLLEKEIE